MCADMHTDMRTDMYIGIRIGMCADMGIYIRIDRQVDLCICMCSCICVDAYLGILVHMCFRMQRRGYGACVKTFGQAAIQTCV